MSVKAIRHHVAVIVVIVLASASLAPAAFAQPLPAAGFDRAVQQGTLSVVVEQISSFVSRLLDRFESVEAQGSEPVQEKTSSTFDPMGRD